MAKELALVRIEDGAVLSTHQEGAGEVVLPGVGHVSPPQLGWEGGGEIITTEGPPRFKLVELVRAETPEGKQRVGNATLALDGDVVRESVEVEDIPPPAPEPTPAEKLASAGLTVADLKSLLGIK